MQSRLLVRPLNWSCTRRVSIIAAAMVVTFSLLDVSAARAGTGYGQITLVNNTSETINYYVNGTFQGAVLPGDFLPVEVRQGPYTLFAQSTTVAYHKRSSSGYIYEGDSLEWAIWVE